MTTNYGRERSQKRPRPPRAGSWTATRMAALWLGAAMVVALPIGLTTGFLLHNAAPRMVAVFAIAVTAFLGILLLAHHVASYRPFDSGEMRMAIAGSFVIVYFVVLAIFLFSIHNPTTFAQDYVRNLTTLMGVIIAFYFASSAAVQYAKINAGTNRSQQEDAGTETAEAATPERDGPHADAPRSAPTATAAPLDEIQRLRGSVAELQASHERLATLVTARGQQEEVGRR